jgi:YggT family protein
VLAESPLQNLVCIVLTVAIILLFIRVILSWAEFLGFRPPITGPGRSAYDLLRDVTEPALRPLRRVVHPVQMGSVGLDISMLLAFVILFVLRAAIGC